MDKHGSSPVALLAILLRVGSLVAIVAAYLLIRHSTIETSFVARYSQDPAEDQIFRVISVFRFWNHAQVMVVAFLGSVVAWKLAVKVGGDRFAFVVTALLPGVLAYAIFSVVVQGLPVRYLAAFLLFGSIFATCAKPVGRALGSGRGMVTRWLLWMYLCVPFVSEILTPRLASKQLYGVRSGKSRSLRSVDGLLSSIAPAWTVMALCHIASYAVAINAINSGTLPDLIKGRRVERIVEGNYHGLELDRRRSRIMATNMDLIRLEGYSIDEHPRKVFERSIPTQELENVRINPERDELYHFDRRSERLRVYHAADLSLKKESTVEIDGGGTAQVEFDNESQTILVTRESDFVWIFDMNSLTLIHQHEEHGGGNADVLFSTVLKAYVLSYYSRGGRFLTVTPTGRYEEFETLPYENDLQESSQRKELFLTLPVEGSVYVYDLGNLHTRKRALATVFGVRGMAYDSTHDLLLTISMVNGYLDVLEPSTGEILDRVFVGYYLREIQLVEERREAFISSRIGGVYRFRY